MLETKPLWDSTAKLKTSLHPSQTEDTTSLTTSHLTTHMFIAALCTDPYNLQHLPGSCPWTSAA